MYNFINSIFSSHHISHKAAKTFAKTFFLLSVINDFINSETDSQPSSPNATIAFILTFTLSLLAYSSIIFTASFDLVCFKILIIFISKSISEYGIISFIFKIESIHI
jgi:hypothetical protein